MADSIAGTGQRQTFKKINFDNIKKIGQGRRYNAKYKKQRQWLNYKISEYGNTRKLPMRKTMKPNGADARQDKKAECQDWEQRYNNGSKGDQNDFNFSYPEGPLRRDKRLPRLNKNNHDPAGLDITKPVKSVENPEKAKYEKLLPDGMAEKIKAKGAKQEGEFTRAMAKLLAN